MSWYTIDHACGHQERHQIYGTNSHGERENRAEWLATTLCEECYAAQRIADREAANAAAAASNKAAALPSLAGSPKQIAWAETIRAGAAPIIVTAISNVSAQRSKLPAMYQPISDDIIAALRSTLALTAAGWWIDHRDQLTVRDIAGDLITPDNMILHTYAA